MSRLPCSAANMRGVCPFCHTHTHTHSSGTFVTLINGGGASGGTYVVAPVHLLEAVQVSSESRQVFVFHIAEEVLDGQRGHLDGRGGVHVCGQSLRPLLEGQEAAASAHRVAAFSRRLRVDGLPGDG